MNRPVNDRQLEVLQWIADGCTTGRWSEDNNVHKISAAALRSRGLAIVTGHGRTWTAAITEAGMHYLKHGGYPANDEPPTAVVSGDPPARPSRAKPAPGKGAPETLAEAKVLIEQLQKQGQLTVSDPDASMRARYRRVLHACRVQDLVPDGRELRFTGRSSGDIVIMLSASSPAETTNWDRIRTTARTVTTNVETLRSALETTAILSTVSAALRPRAIGVVLSLAEELRTHDLKLGANVKLKKPRLFVQVGTRRRNLELTELLDEVPHVLTDAEQRELRRSPWKQFPKFDNVPSGRLHLKIERDGSHEVHLDHRSYRYERNSDTWSDETKRPLETRVREVARAIKKGVVDDTETEERQKRERTEAREAYERVKAAERQAWEAIRDRARSKALLVQRETIFARSFENWQGARELREFADQLEAAAIAKGLLAERPRLEEWLEWARTRADWLDPILNLELLDDGVCDTEPSVIDLRPHMEGWDPSAPHKDYSIGRDSQQRQVQTDSQPRAWHPGMRDRPSWWSR